MSSLRWHISWTHRRTDRTSKQQPCPLGTRLAPHVCFVFLSFIFLLFCVFSFLSFMFLFSSFSFFSGVPVHTMVLFLVYFGCKWYGMVYHSSLAPFLLRTTGIYYGAPTLSYFSPIKNVSACFVTTGQISGEKIELRVMWKHHPQGTKQKIAAARWLLRPRCEGPSWEGRRGAWSQSSREGGRQGPVVSAPRLKRLLWFVL